MYLEQRLLMSNVGPLISFISKYSEFFPKGCVFSDSRAMGHESEVLTALCLESHEEKRIKVGKSWN